MSDETEAFVGIDMSAAREPVTHATSLVPGKSTTGDGEEGALADTHRRRRRRPRKIIVYYFDSDSEDEDEDGVTDAMTAELNCAPDNNLDASNSQVVRRYKKTRSRANADASSAGKAACVEAPRIGSPTPMCFYVFGITTLLYNVHNAQLCDLNMATMGLVTMVGGLTQFVSGFFELINKNTLGCTISSTYGAFWMATTILFLWPQNDYVTMGNNTYSGAFFLVWFFFALSLLAASMRSPLTCIALFVLVPLNFLMQSIGFFMDSQAVARAAGFEGILVGMLAMYLGAAFILREVYGRTVLPLLFHDNMRIVEW